jgi:N-acetylneuraminate synthase
VGFYLVATEFLERERKFIVPGISLGVPVDGAHGIDIDAPLDLIRAEATLADLAKGATFPLGAKRIGKGNPCYVIAEAGVNHNGSLDMALELVRKAAEAGADAVKFQTFKAENLVSESAPMAKYQKENLRSNGGQLEMLRKLELTAEEFHHIYTACHDHGIQFLSTPFDMESARLLDGMGVPAFKVGSGEITNLPFLHALASLGKPILLSTGMSDMVEVEAAVSTIRAAGDFPLAIMHCTSAYPAPAESCNLRAMDSLTKTFAVPVGYSDHTVGWDVCLAAVSLGATILEKHFTLDPSLPGPDHRASLDPAQLKKMIQEIRRVESALGTGVKAPVEAEMDTRLVARKSLVLARAVDKGGTIQEEDLTVKRPGTGIPPSQWRSVVGRRLKVDGAAERVLSWDDLEG